MGWWAEGEPSLASSENEELKIWTIENFLKEFCYQVVLYPISPKDSRVTWL